MLCSFDHEGERRAGIEVGAGRRRGRDDRCGVRVATGAERESEQRRDERQGEATHRQASGTAGMGATDHARPGQRQQNQRVRGSDRYGEEQDPGDREGEGVPGETVVDQPIGDPGQVEAREPVASAELPGDPRLEKAHEDHAVAERRDAAGEAGAADRWHA